MDKKIQIIDKLYELYSTLPKWEKSAIAKSFEIEKDRIYVRNIVPSQGKIGYLFTYHNSYRCKITQKGIEILQLLSAAVGIQEMVILDYISLEKIKKIDI